LLSNIRLERQWAIVTDKEKPDTILMKIEKKALLHFEVEWNGQKPSVRTTSSTLDQYL
jgi:hypothetical protein